VRGARWRGLRLLPATVASLVALGALLLTPPVASATFHEILVREVYPGGVADDSYVMLQAYSGGQNFVAGHSLTAYDATGNEIGSFTFGTDADNGQNQMTILVADTAYAGPSPDGSVARLNLNPAGGAACWASLDCVSWGSFRGSLPSPAGTPAPAIPDEMALRRTIAPGCPTLLESSDDHNNSAVDFDVVFPNPRPNSVAPTEHACDSSGSAGPGGNQPGAPQTRLTGKPRKAGRGRTPTFRFNSSEAGSTFQCKVDRKPFRDCRSPFTVKRLSLGDHVFRVRARDAGGRIDPSPATFRFRVVRRG
jgi:hypothetical protein